MRFPLLLIQNQIAAATRRSASRGGFSLLEVLLIIGMLSVTILPFTLLMSQTAGNARGAYIQSSRSILLNSIMDETSVTRNSFTHPYDTTAMVSSSSESGQVLPFRRKVDESNSDTFKKTVYFYLYNNATDAFNAPRYKTKLVFQQGTMRTRFDSGRNGFMDSSGFYWNHSNGYQESGHSSIPGFPTAGSYVPSSSAVTIVNLPSHKDAELYRIGRYNTAASMTYQAKVANGLYTVKLHFIEITHPTRLMDIYLEGKLMNPGNPYNAYVICGNRYFCGNVQMFDIDVRDGVLNVQLSPNSGAGHTNPFISAISIIKRT